MTAQVVVLIGPVRSGKTSELVREYRAALERSPAGTLDRAIWLATNGRTAAAVREQLVESGLAACLEPGVMTFDDLARQILVASKSRLKLIDDVLKREIVRRVVEAALAGGKLKFYADAAGRSAFIGPVAEHIAELKRRRIRPAVYAKLVSRRSSPDGHAELAELYASYESLLEKFGLVDREGIFDAAIAALAENRCERFGKLKLVVADGFSDFTLTQHEMLSLLNRRADRLLISLPGDGGDAKASERNDLFAKSLGTLRELQFQFPELELRRVAPRPLPCPAIDYIANNVFANPKQITAPRKAVVDSLDHIEIIEAAGVQDEVVQIARRIKALLTGTKANGVGDASYKPHDILVVFRSIGDVAARIREVFDRCGIPYFLDARLPLSTAAALKTIMSLLQLDLEDWPFRGVVSTLTNNLIGAIAEGARRAAEWLVRDLQIASGRAGLVARVDSLAGEPLEADEYSEYQRRRIAAARAAMPALAALAGALEELPKKATPSAWADALGRLRSQLQIPAGESDETAWQLVVAHLAALERLNAWVGEPHRELSRSELVRVLRDLANNAFLPEDRTEFGRVRVLSAPAARNIAARHVFLAGMSEQAFPSAERAGRLAIDADYRHLEHAARGQTASPAAPAANRAQGEMLLFYEVLSRADRSLTISYPALDDKAQTMPPSPYVIEIDRLFGEKTRHEIPRTSPHLSPIATDTTPFSVADWRVQAVSRAIGKDRDCRMLGDVFACGETNPLAVALDAGLRIVHARARGESFGPAEGLLTSPAVAARLAQRFGPQHVWSASQWETYATCPFRFFMEVVLGLEPLGDLALETDFARRGSRLHDVLAAFHRDWVNVRRERGLSPSDEAAAFLAHLEHVAHKRTAVGGRVGIDAALLELDRRQILKWARGHFDHHTKYDGGFAKLGAAMTPTYFEFRFGSARAGDSEADPKSTGDAYVIHIDGEPIRVSGQIDRIDVASIEGKQVFNVIDYKSGRRATLKPELLDTGQQLQLPLYVEAAQVLVFSNEATPLAAGYWSMGSGFDNKGPLAVIQEGNDSRWQETQKKVHGLVRKFIDAIRNGEFPVASRDDKCTSTCDFRLVCRVSQARSLGKIWWDDTADDLAQSKR